MVDIRKQRCEENATILVSINGFYDTLQPMYRFPRRSVLSRGARRVVQGGRGSDAAKHRVAVFGFTLYHHRNERIPGT